jgi:hypothetical protein
MAKKAKAKATTELSILDVIQDPAIFGPWFKDPSFAPWIAFLKTVFGHPLDETELKLFQECTGRTMPFAVGYLIAALVIGRRGGKSLCLAVVAAYLSAFKDWTPYLTGGEVGHIVILSADRRSAKAIFGYLKGMLSIPLLEGLITRETAETIELGSKRIAISIETASFKTIRGRTIVAALCDESAFWSADDSGANPDSEVIAAIKPAMLSIPGSMLFMASSPYSRRGVLWDEYRKHFGKDESSTLVWQAPTKTMNPKAPQSLIDEMYESDPARAAAEYGAQFRTDVESFISREAVDAVVVDGVLERPPVFGLDYLACVDPSGGSSDSMTLAISHRENDRTILDAIREVRPPFSPESVVTEFATLLKSYSIKSVVGDRYAGLWPRERFLVHGIDYEVSEKTKSDIYRDLLPLINSGQVELLDHPKLTAQLCSLERRTARGGKDSIDHPPGGAHDDLANAAAGALTLASGKANKPTLLFASVSNGSRPYDGRSSLFPSGATSRFLF